jgi:hypothetical protein
MATKLNCTIFTYNKKLHKIICHKKMIFQQKMEWEGSRFIVKKKTPGGHSSQPRQLCLPIIIDRFVGLGQDLKNKTYSKNSSTPARNVLC